jgi:hypothetical protein
VKHVVYSHQHREHVRGGMPPPFIADYALHNWIRSLRELESWDFTEHVGSHGTPLAQIPDRVAAALQGRFQHPRGFNGIVRDNVRRTTTYYRMGW